MLRVVQAFAAPAAALIVAVAVVRGVSRREAIPTPPRQGAPHVVASFRDDPRVVADEQLAAVLHRVRPLQTGNRTNVLLHALRLWGDSVPGDATSFSGAELRDYFTDDAVFRQIAGEDTLPLFQQDGDSVRVRLWEGSTIDVDSSAAHRNDVLATFAEIGLPLETPLQLRSGEATVADLLATALGDFHAQEFEYEWTAIAYGRYAYPLQSWTNRFGDRQTPHDLARELLEQPWEQGVCGGTHRLEAAVVLLRVDEQRNLLPPDVRRMLLNRLTDVAAMLHASQHAEGWWARTWPTGTTPSAAGSPLSDRLLATGHHLEWLALAPAEIELPREQIVRAGQWLAAALQEVDDDSLAELYGPYSHAARALCLWRGAEAADHWQRLALSAASTSDQERDR